MSRSLRLLLCAWMVIFQAGCSTFDAPDMMESDPAARDARLVATLDKLHEGAEIYIVLADGSEIRARYNGWYDEDEMLASPIFPGWKALLRGSTSRAVVYRFEDIRYVAYSKLTLLTKLTVGAGMIVLVATFVMMANVPPDDGP